MGQRLLCVAAASALGFCSVARAESYDTRKIRRIIQVSAAYFDLNPWGEPVDDEVRVDTKAPFSFLPSIKDKEFAQDMPWLHSVPVVSVAHPLMNQKGWQLSSSTSFGALIPGLERLVGVSSGPRQWLLGGGLRARWSSPEWEIWSEMGLQTTSTRVTGLNRPVKSSIETRSDLQWIGIGIRSRSVGIWSSFLLGQKDTVASVFTNQGLFLHERDKLQDTHWPLWLVGTTGYDFGDYRVALSEVWLPERLFMPRVLLSYRIL